jgi:hypothetical protein
MELRRREYGKRIYRVIINIVTFQKYILQGVKLRTTVKFIENKDEVSKSYLPRGGWRDGRGAKGF